MSWFFGSSTPTIVEKKEYTYTFPTEKDFDTYRKEALSDAKEWVLCHDKEDVKVWSKKDENSPIDMIKLWATFDCEPQLLYDLIQDDKYFILEMNDELFLDWKLVHTFDDSNQITYYASKSPFPIIYGRDFVTMRSFYKTDSEFFISLKSVEHKDFPENSSLVRATVIRTGYYIFTKDNKTTLIYSTQTNLNGYIPSYVMNFGSQTMAPQLIDKLKIHLKKYPEWKKKQETKK